MSATPKNRRQPSGEWLGFPDLEIEDIEHEAFKFTRHIAQSMVNNRKGRVYLLMEHDLHQRFLSAVRKKFGNLFASSVERAALEAIKAWVEKVEAQ